MIMEHRIRQGPSLVFLWGIKTILIYLEGNGWAWRVPIDGGLLESSASWAYLEEIAAGGPGDSLGKEALRDELVSLCLSLDGVALQLANGDQVLLDL